MNMIGIVFIFSGSAALLFHQIRNKVPVTNINVVLVFIIMFGFGIGGFLLK